MSTVLCAPDKFRGSLTARQAATAMAAGVADAGHDVVELPLSDGGEGTLDTLLAAAGGVRRWETVTGPYGSHVEADWGLLPDGTAIVELARASGLALAEPANDPVGATTRGTGELIAAAAREGAASVLVAVGGSATTDGGVGALEALGWRLPIPVVVACDVAATFLDAAAVFGPQKGATPEQVTLLTRRLEVLASRYRAETGVDVTDLPGAGAAGGTAGGLAAYGAELRPGFDLVARACGLTETLGSCARVLTGEGRLDDTSLDGKVVGGVAAAAAAAGVPVGVIAGSVAAGTTVPGARVVDLTAIAGHLDPFADAAALVRLAALRLCEEA